VFTFFIVHFTFYIRPKVASFSAPLA
jgi:hypothetical protein